MPRRILVIDDSEVIRALARIGLQRAGWSVDVAEDGDEGLRAAASRRHDAVLLDLNMPGLDGLEVLRRLRADDATAALPVILLTASAHHPDDHGADAVIAKPFPPLELAELVRDRLGWTDGAA